MNLKVTFIFLLLLLPVGVMAQMSQSEKSRLMQKADSAFYAGDYVQAKSFYTRVYGIFGDTAAKTQIKKCSQCYELLSQATSAEQNGQYNLAIEKYQAIAAINPRDIKVSELIAQCKSRQYTLYLQTAKRLYREGKYTEASEKLNEYILLSGLTDAELLTAITKGITWSNEATTAFNKKDYTTAKTYYDRLLAANPTDAISAKALAGIERLLQPAKTVYIDKSNYKNKNQVNGTALAYSIVPGIGLIQKGHKTEGAIYLAGDIVLLGAGIGLNSYASNQKKIMDDHNTSINEYNKAKNNYDSTKTISNICFGVAAGLYVVNLIRSYVAKPKSGAKLQWTITSEMFPMNNNRVSNLLINTSLCYTF